MTDLPVAVMKERPGDFVVEELPAYAPSGRGEHLFVTFRKTDRTTLDVLRDMARALGVDARGAGFAGMKDRNAVTTQTVSFPFPIARAVAEAEARLALPGVEVLSVARHDHKLKPGHLAGNRFTVTLRGLAPEAVPGVRAALEAAGREGVPNAFGPQRFGRDGDNPARALAWLAGREKGPRDRATQRLLVSALQSLLYNRVLAGREAEGTFRRVLPGDVAKKTDTGGLFVVPPDGPDAEDAARRGDAGLLHPTGPMFGAKMRWPEGRPLVLEREVLAEALGEGADADARLAAFRHLGEGTRRSLVLPVAELAAEPLAVDGNAGAGLVVRFVLPKGGYATTVLGRVCVLKEPRRQAALAEEGRGEEDGAAEGGAFGQEQA